MDVVSYASGSEQPRIVVSQNSADVSVEMRFDFRIDEGLSVFGGEDDVYQKAGEVCAILFNLS